MKKIMYPELISEMAKSGITQRQIAAAINLSTRALYNRLTGETEFTWNETRTIQEQFFPHRQKEELFQAKSN